MFRGGEVQKFSWAEIQFGLHKEDVIVGERGEIGAVRYVLPYEFVGVFDETFLPGGVRVCEIDLSMKHLQISSLFSEQC